MKRSVLLFSDALHLIESQNFVEARNVLSEYQALCPDDVYAQELIALCSKMVSEPEEKKVGWTFVRFVHKRLHGNVGISEDTQDQKEYSQAQMDSSKEQERAQAS